MKPSNPVHNTVRPWLTLSAACQGSSRQSEGTARRHIPIVCYQVVR